MDMEVTVAQATVVGMEVTVAQATVVGMEVRVFLSLFLIIIDIIKSE